MTLSYVEVSRAALRNNLAQFKALAGSARVAPVVKANAYGHGLVETAQVLADAGADWLCVNAANEAHALRRAGIALPLYILGFVAPHEVSSLVQLDDIRLVVYQEETIRTIALQAHRFGRSIPLHLKVETGNNRQGVDLEQARALARVIAESPGVFLEGLSSHYADIEDTTDHTFAHEQLARFNAVYEALVAEGTRPPVRNFTNSAAAILWQETRFELVRVGLAMYGMWPSKETLVSAVTLGVEKPALQPALTWKTTVAQVKTVPAGAFVGYGRTFQATRPTRLAVLPVGYYEGYDRRLSNLAHVLVRGGRAPVRGRICMNMTMVDVTDIPGVRTGDEVVLLGRQGDHEVPAEQIAAWANTINYEVTTRIHENIPRHLVD